MHTSANWEGKGGTRVGLEDWGWEVGVGMYYLGFGLLYANIREY